MLVFDITNKQSFDNVEMWKDEFFNKAMPKDPENIPTFVLGNKIDLEDDRIVSQDMIESMKTKNPQFNYTGTSAVKSENINEVFI